MANGTWIQTYSNKKLDFLDPDPDSIIIGDIAIALSRTCRFAGHTEWFYSVAQHSVNTAMVAPNDTVALYALLHDAHEAYTGDIPQPLKRLLPAVLMIEDRIQVAIYTALGIPYPSLDTIAKIKEIDMRMLVTENRKMFLSNLWDFEVEGYNRDEADTDYWNSTTAQHTFLFTYRVLESRNAQRAKVKSEN